MVEGQSSNKRKEVDYRLLQTPIDNAATLETLIIAKCQLWYILEGGGMNLKSTRKQGTW